LYRGLLRDFHQHSNANNLREIRLALDFIIKNDAGLKEPVTGIYQVLHVIFVARIIAKELGLGRTSVIGALLLQNINGTDYKEIEIEEIFGKDIAGIVSSLSRISGIDMSKTSFQIESFKKLILTLAGDIQVLLIAIAERLQLMRNLDESGSEIQRKVANEALLYASLAHHLGLYNIKSEMEDLSMKYLEPDKYQMISEKLVVTTRSRNRFIREFIKPIREKLDGLGIKYEIKGRLKSVYSIWSKMKVQDVEFEEVYDLFAIRVIIESNISNERALCWQVYSVITDIYTPNPKRLRDWISISKSNGYESLHTTVVSPKGRWVEVQIRTQRMNSIAEKGLAAHWLYKGGASDKIMDEWLASMKEILDAPEPESRGLLDEVKLNLTSEEIFVFTPNGDLKRLKHGATLLDFAFEIHSDLGARCVGGKVNHKNVTLKHELFNGDLVEVTTSKNQKPKQDWLNYVVSSKAKTRIRLALNEEKQKTAEIGKEILKRRLRNWKIVFNDSNVRSLLKHYGLKNAQDLYFRISEEKIDLIELKSFLLQQRKPNLSHQVTESTEKRVSIEAEKVPKYDDFLIIENKVENMDYKFSRCCKPKPGDRIFGFVTIKEGIKIHRMDCPNARQMIRRYPYRVIQTKWTESVSGSTQVYVLNITGKDDMGLVNRITELISSDLKVNMQSVNFVSKEKAFVGEIKVLVRDQSHIEVLTKKLLKIKAVIKVSAYAE
ncbi:MAG: RelA/SpoT family protein, partial [Bacteroidota bacterium]|nr:RelA/SpoT family protein [Bacteroidota bacterium]